MANGDTPSCSEMATINFTISNDASVIHTCKARTMKNLSTDIILGMQFLENNNTIIDLNDRIIVIDGRQYKLENRSQKFDDKDRLLCDKTKIITCKETTRE